MNVIVKRTLWTVGILGVVTALYLFLGKRGGDDQPPIIVSDGTVHMKADFDPHGNGRGEWEMVDGKPLVWAYRHSGGKATGSIDVNVLDGASDACDNPSELFLTVTKIVAQYADGVTVTIVFDNSQSKYRRLQATFAGLAVANNPKKHKGYDFWLEAGLPDTKLMSADITRGGGSPIPCTLGEHGEIRILQRKE